MHLERIINCIDVLLWHSLFYDSLRPKSSDSRRIAILCFTFAYCIVSCRGMSSLLAFQFFSFFFSLSLYLHVMSLHDPFLFDLIFVNIYTRRDLKLIEIQIKPIVTFLRNYLLLAMKIYSTKPRNLQNRISHRVIYNRNYVLFVRFT